MLSKMLKLPSALLIVCVILSACNYPETDAGTTAPATLLPSTGETPASSPTMTDTPAQATPTSTATAMPAVTQTQAPVLGERLSPGEALTVNVLHMLDESQGWGIGQGGADAIDRVLFTIDGGETWEDRTPLTAIGNPPADGLRAVAYFLDAQHAWVTFSPAMSQPLDGDHLVWRTLDGGQSWQPGQVLDRQNLMADFFIPSDLQFLDAQHGWILAHLGVGMSHDYFAVYTTRDGGDRWERVTDPESHPEMMGCVKSGMAFLTLEDGWLGGNCPGLMPRLFLYRTTDGGRTWNEALLPVPDGLAGVTSSTLGDRCGIDQFINITSSPLRFVLSCPNFDRGEMDAWLYTSPDGGESFTFHLLPTAYNRFDFTDSGQGWLLSSLSGGPDAEGEIYHTADNGESWTSVRAVGWHGEIDFIDGDTGWVLAQKGDQRAAVVSHDGGSTWEQLHPVIR